MKHVTPAALGLLLISGLVWAGDLPQSLRGATPVSDSAPPPEMAEYPDKGKALPRSLAHQPPLIPHKPTYPITTARNGCTGCHDPKRAKMMKATPTHSSHLDEEGGLKNTYYLCKQCHVPQQTVAEAAE
ncbi:nitrate reductase cytochrome c-type subunit [Ferrimonas gelatinilytica]|uniref:Periplasmic nitrate reductase, electron transfer subunit n=1 Tax=Ferrimonas gelatinilytica TaxID=1255257 RepID=A0ABP9RV84_9GAMM